MNPSKFFLSTLIAAAAMTAPAYATGEIVSLNFGKNEISSDDTGTAGLVEVEAIGWTNALGQSGTLDSVKNYDGTEIDGIDVSWSGPQEPYAPVLNLSTVAGALQSSYLDLNAWNTWTVSVSNSFLVADVYVYLSGDGGLYSPVWINGVSYVGGENVRGEDAWGTRDSSETITLGTNAIKVTSLVDSSFSLSNVVMGDSYKRGTLSGIQIVNTYAGVGCVSELSADTNWTNVSFGSSWANSQSAVSTSKQITTTNGVYADFTLLSDTTLTVDCEVVTDAIYVSGEGKTLTLYEGDGGSLTLSGPATLRVNAGARLVLNASAVSLGENISGIFLAGTGTVQLLDEDGTSAYNSFSNASSFLGTMSFANSVSLDADSTAIISGGKREFNDGVSGHSLGVTSGATVTISGGESSFTGVAVSGTWLGEDNSIQVSGTSSVLNITGGTITLSKSMGLHNGGTVNQSDGVLTTTAIRLHDSGGVSGTDTYNLSGGVVNIGNTTVGNSTGAGILIGHWGNGKGVLNVSGTGVLNAEKTWAVVSWSSPGEFNISGGEVNVKGISLDGQLSTWGSDNSAVVTLSGGRLNIGADGLGIKTDINGWYYGDGSYSGTNKAYNLNGGTLGALDSWTASAPLKIGGSVTIDTTKRVVSEAGASSAATGGDAGATITLGNLAFAGAGTLTLEGAGTVVLNGTITGVSTDDSAAKITLSSGKLQFGDNLVYALTGADDSISGKSLKIATVNGGTIDGTLDASNFTWNGVGLSSRVQVAFDSGVATFTGTSYNLFWKGGSAGTWDTTTATTFGKDSATGEDTAFVAGDNVTFNTSGDVAVTVNESISVGTLTISDGNVSISGEGNVSAKETVVSGGGTLTLGQNGGGSTSYVRGVLTIGDGGTVSLDGGDATGWNGGATAINKITINKGGELVINTNSNTGTNQTFNMKEGVILQGGKITGTNEDGYSKFDLFGATSEITTLASDTTAEISASVGLRDTGKFNVSKGTTSDGVDLHVSGMLTSWSGVVRDTTQQFTATFTKTGAGTLKLSGDNLYWTTGGTISEGKVIAASTTALGTGDITLDHGAELEISCAGTLKLEDASLYGTTTVLSGATLDLTNATRGKDDGAGHMIVDGGTLKIADLGWGTGTNYGANYNHDRLKISNGGVLEVTAAQENNGSGNRGFMVTHGIGVYRYTGAEASYLSESGYDYHRVSLENGTTLVFDIVDKSASLTVSKVIAQGESNAVNKTTASIEKNGEGTLTLSGANLYSGGTTIVSGTLIAGKAGALGSGAVKVFSGATLQADTALELSADLTVVVSDSDIGESGSGLITGSGVTLTGTATLLVDIQSLTSVASDDSADSIALKIATNNALTVTQDRIEIGWWNDTEWIKSSDWSVSNWDSASGTLTMTIPEPSAFGLLAGAGALALVVARRKRRK